MIEVITPCHDCSKFSMSGIFLAGPTYGTWDWQAKVIELIKEQLKDFNEDVFIASPRVQNYYSAGRNLEKETDWETKYLNSTGLYGGVIMFWLASEAKHYYDKSYTRTIFQLAEWATAKNEWDVEMVIGFDTSFSDSKYIQQKLKNLKIPFCYSLEETTTNAVDLFINSRSKEYGL